MHQPAQPPNLEPLQNERLFSYTALQVIGEFTGRDGRNEHCRIDRVVKIDGRTAQNPTRAKPSSLQGKGKAKFAVIDEERILIISSA